jgi:hypothetical protein
MTGSFAIELLAPMVRECCATCDLCGFRDSNDDEPPLRFCQRDGMYVDDHHFCSGFVPLLPPSAARSVAHPDQSYMAPYGGSSP